MLLGKRRAESVSPTSGCRNLKLFRRFICDPKSATSCKTIIRRWWRFSHIKKVVRQKYGAITFWRTAIKMSQGEEAPPDPCRTTVLALKKLCVKYSSILWFLTLHIFILKNSVRWESYQVLPYHTTPPPRTFHLFSPLYHPSSPSPALFTVLPPSYHPISLS